MIVLVIALAYVAIAGWLAFYREHRRATLASQRADKATLLAEMNARHYTAAMNGWRQALQRNETTLAGWRAALRLLVAKELDDNAIAEDARAQERVH